MYTQAASTCSVHKRRGHASNRNGIRCFECLRRCTKLPMLSVPLCCKDERELVETNLYRYETIILSPRLLAGRSRCCVADYSLCLIPLFVSPPHPRRRSLHQLPFSSLLVRGALRDQHQRQAFEEARSALADALKAALVDDEPHQMDDKFRPLFCAPRVWLWKSFDCV